VKLSRCCRDTRAWLPISKASRLPSKVDPVAERSKSSPRRAIARIGRAGVPDRLRKRLRPAAVAWSSAPAGVCGSQGVGRAALDHASGCVCGEPHPRDPWRGWRSHHGSGVTDFAPENRRAWTSTDGWVGVRLVVSGNRPVCRPVRSIRGGNLTGSASNATATRGCPRGLWVGNGSDGWFRNLKVIPASK
jgi:hypothetical protein